MIKGTLTSVKDLGFQVNRLNSSELVDHCTLKFKTEDGEEFYTYPLTKGCHASSRLGKIIRILLGRDMTKEDFDENNNFESDVLIGLTAYIEVGDNKYIIGVNEANV